MNVDIREIAATFDARSAGYARDGWHKRCAERLVELCRLQPGAQVLDAGTGTGFAALAAARAVGGKGVVHGVDISPGMLREARAAVTRSGLANVHLVEADAVRLPQYGTETFDAITCSSGLLYMPAVDALREWHRLLKTGGLVAFSTMRAGAPRGARIFRDCATEFGICLPDPSEPLGSVSACRQALEGAGFTVAEIVAETVEFSDQDQALAWDSNVRSVAHSEVRRLSDEQQLALKGRYLDALAREASENPGALDRADILYALGRR